MTTPQIRILWTLALLMLAGGIAIAAWQIQTIPTDTIALEQAMAAVLGTTDLSAFDSVQYLADQTAEHRFYAAGGALLAALGVVSGLLALSASSVSRSIRTV